MKMAVTLAQAKLNVQNDLQMGVIDEFAKSNFLMNALTFDDCINPSGGGATLTYAYNRMITQATAAFRDINTEYTAQEATKQQYLAELKHFGGSFSVDRVIANMGGVINEVTMQMQQKIKAASALFNDTVINGDTAVDSKSFDGLDKAVTGSSTEYVPTVAIDLSTSALVDTNYKAFLDQLDEFLMSLDGTPDFIGGNLKLIAKIRACARRAGMYTTRANEFGMQVGYYGDTPLVDFGAKSGSNAPVVSTNAQGETSLYAARLGLDGFHAVSMAGVAPVQTWLPKFDEAGAVKKGEVEMTAAVVLKSTKAAGILRKVKVQ
jgi:hypothetical protein